MVAPEGTPRGPVRYARSAFPFFNLSFRTTTVLGSPESASGLFRDRRGVGFGFDTRFGLFNRVFSAPHTRVCVYPHARSLGPKQPRPLHVTDRPTLPCSQRRRRLLFRNETRVPKTKKIFRFFVISARTQFAALVRKNFTLKTRGILCCCTGVEIVLPCFFLALLCLPKALVKDSRNSDAFAKPYQVSKLTQY